MRSLSHAEFSSALGVIEPHLEQAMGEHPGCVSAEETPETPRLCQSICGFASQVLQRVLAEYRIKTELVAGAASVDSSQLALLPRGMRRHAVLRTENATIDPTFGQFMQVALLERDETERALPQDFFPNQRIAYIPAGQERFFGERYAEFILRKRRILQIGEVALEDSSQDNLRETISGIWQRDRYAPRDLSDDLGIYVHAATESCLNSIHSAEPKT